MLSPSCWLRLAIVVTGAPLVVLEVVSSITFHSTLMELCQKRNGEPIARRMALKPLHPEIPAFAESDQPACLPDFPASDESPAPLPAAWPALPARAWFPATQSCRFPATDVHLCRLHCRAHAPNESVAPSRQWLPEFPRQYAHVPGRGKARCRRNAPPTEFPSGSAAQLLHFSQDFPAGSARPAAAQTPGDARQPSSRAPACADSRYLRARPGAKSCE